MKKFTIIVLFINFTFTKCTSQGDVRLVNGKTFMEGKVEIFHNGQWGTVCDDLWNIDDARVVCHQLGFIEALVATDEGYFGRGSGPIWLAGVRCEGRELNISACVHAGWNNHACDHSEDAGARCTMSTSQLMVKLVGGNTFADGTLQVRMYSDHLCNTVCADGWDNNGVRVVCRELGFEGLTYDESPAGSELEFEGYCSFFSEGYSLHCNGTESRLQDCTRGENCNILADEATANCACGAGYWGHLCSECHCLENKACSPISGNCIRGSACAAGWQGFPWCQTECSIGEFESNCAKVCHCLDNRYCDKSNGSCQGQPCQAGWQSAGGEDDCQQGCPYGRFGIKCEGPCHCQDTGDCVKENGTCPRTGCAAGWMGENCQLACPDGQYGAECVDTCHCNGECEKETGHCDRKGCAPGWKSTEFKLNCQEECSFGEFGSNCGGICHCLDNSYCNKANGSCEGRPCQAGWQSAQGKDDCQQECQDGRFGPRCEGICHCQDDEDCGKENGTCTESGCAPGWMGTTCQQVCPIGSYGLKCSSNCTCSNCNSQDGSCGLDTGSLSFVRMLAIVVGGTVYILLLLWVAMCFCRKKETHRDVPKDEPYHEESIKNISSDIKEAEISEEVYDDVNAYSYMSSEDVSNAIRPREDMSDVVRPHTYVNEAFSTEETPGKKTDKKKGKNRDKKARSYVNVKIGKGDDSSKLDQDNNVMDESYTSLRETNLK